MWPSKSGITPQIYRVGCQAGAIKPVRRAGWEWAAGLLQQHRVAWAECTCAGARIRISLSFSVARVSLILPPSRSAMRRSASKCNAGALSLIFTPHSVHRAEHLHVVRLMAVLLSHHVAVGPSKIMRVDAIILFAKLGGATGPYLSLAHDVPLAKRHRRPRTSCFVPGEF